MGKEIKKRLGEKSVRAIASLARTSITNLQNSTSVHPTNMYLDPRGCPARLCSEALNPGVQLPHYSSADNDESRM